MRQKRYKVVMVGVVDTTATPKARMALVPRPLRRWWAWHWKLRLSTLCFIAGTLILLMRFA